MNLYMYKGMLKIYKPSPKENDQGPWNMQWFNNKIKEDPLG